MGDDYEVGYGKPPRNHQFKKGNQAARKRRNKSKAISLSEIMDRALRSKRKVRRGNEVYSVAVAEILIERLIHQMTTGSAHDLTRIIQLIERCLPDALATATEPLEIRYHRAEGSSVTLPPDDLWNKL